MINIIIIVITSAIVIGDPTVTTLRSRSFTEKTPSVSCRTMPYRTGLPLGGITGSLRAAATRRTGGGRCRPAVAPAARRRPGSTRRRRRRRRQTVTAAGRRAGVVLRRSTCRRRARLHNHLSLIWCRLTTQTQHRPTSTTTSSTLHVTAALNSSLSLCELHQLTRIFVTFKDHDI